MKQKTLVLIKPDAMERNLAGEIIARFERVSLKLVDCKMLKASDEVATAHYPVTDEWLTKVGNNTLSDCKKFGIDVIKTMGTDDPIKIGKKVHQWNKEYIMSGPIMAIVFEGIHAIEVVRKLCGPTLPLIAPPGTIRGDYSSASAISENAEGKAIRNLIHASGTEDEAKREIELWFSTK